MTAEEALGLELTAAACDQARAQRDELAAALAVERKRHDARQELFLACRRSQVRLRAALERIVAAGYEDWGRCAYCGALERDDGQADYEDGDAIRSGPIHRPHWPGCEVDALMAAGVARRFGT